MKVNVFANPVGDAVLLRAKLESTGMSILQAVQQDGWVGDFYCSPDENPKESSWVAPYRTYFADLPIPETHSPFAVFLFSKDQQVYAGP
jgi:hypothetical protein